MRLVNGKTLGVALSPILAVSTDLDSFQQDSIADSVRQIIKASQLVTHSMNIAQSCAVESHASQKFRITVDQTDSQANNN